jgi:hypothetical protein
MATYPTAIGQRKYVKRNSTTTVATIHFEILCITTPAWTNSRSAAAFFENLFAGDLASSS